MRLAEHGQLKWVTLISLLSIMIPYAAGKAEDGEWSEQTFKGRARAVLLATQKELHSAEFWRDTFSEAAAQLAQQLIRNQDDVRGVVWIHALLREAEGEVQKGSRMLLAYAAREVSLNSPLSQSACAILEKERTEWLSANQELSPNLEAELEQMLNQSPPPTFEQALACVCLTAVSRPERKDVIAQLCLGRFALSNNAPDTAAQHFTRAALMAEEITERQIAASAWLHLAETLCEQDNLDEVCSAIERSLKMGPPDQSSLLRATRLLVKTEQHLPKAKLHRLCSMLLVASPGYRPQEIQIQEALGDLDKLKLEYFDKISERVFMNVAEAMGPRFALKDDFSDSLFSTEMDALDANYMTSDGARIAEMLCRMWGPRDEESGAMFRATMGYAIWLRYADSPAGNAGLSTFLDSMKPTAVNVLSGVDFESESPENNPMAIADQIEEAFSTSGLSDTQCAWLGLYLATASNAKVFKALGNARVGFWLNEHGRNEVGIGYLHDQISSVSDEEAAAVIWRMVAESNASNRPRVTVSSYLAGATCSSNATLKQETYARAVEVLLEHEREALALEILGRLPQGSAGSEAIGEFIVRTRTHAEKELPLLRERMSRHSDVEVGVQAFLRAGQYHAVQPDAVEELCRELMDKEPGSRVGEMAFVAEAERSLHDDNIEECISLLSKLSASGVSDATRLRISELTADYYLQQGKLQRAVEEYRDATAGYGYASKQHKFGLVSKRGHDLSNDIPPDMAQLEAQCLKGYLLLARGRDWDGTACLEHALVKLHQFSQTTEIRRFMTPVVHGLLSRAYLDRGEYGLAAVHWRHFSRHAAGDEQPLPRQAMLDFAKQLAQCVASKAESHQQTKQDDMRTASQSQLQRAELAVSEGNLIQAQAYYTEALRQIGKQDTQPALDACEAVLQGMCQENGPQGFDVALHQFRAWAAGTLSHSHENCSVLAIAKAQYRKDNLAQASAEIEGCLAVGKSRELIKQAQLLSGIISFRSGQFDKANESFEAVLTTSAPEDEVRAQVLFFIGYISITNGDSVKGRATLKRLAERHPNSNYAKKSAALLARLRTGG